MTVLPIVLASTLIFGPDPGTIVTAAPDALIDVGGRRLRFEVEERTDLIVDAVSRILARIDRGE